MDVIRDVGIVGGLSVKQARCQCSIQTSLKLIYRLDGILRLNYGWQDEMCLWFVSCVSDVRIRQCLRLTRGSPSLVALEEDILSFDDGFWCCLVWFGLVGLGLWVGRMLESGTGNGMRSS